MFRKKKKDISGESLGRKAWLRFKQNRLSMVSFWFLILAVFVAILGYVLTPDKTPFCNQQHLELSTKKPGFTCQFLLVRKNTHIEKPNFFKSIIQGTENPYYEIPISNYIFKDNFIEVENYTSKEDSSGIKKNYLLADVCFALRNPNGKQIKQSVDIHGNNLTHTSVELIQKIEQKHILNKRFLLGTDRYGRDLLSRLILGTRISLSVGFIAVLISLIVGITLGILAGYFRGVIDDVIMWLINVVWSIPTLLIVIAITLVMGKGFWVIFVAVGLTMWVEVARVTRGQVLSVREMEYVEAARALGYSNTRIMFRHILPNVFSPLIVISAANFASSILIEAGLSFLGIGVQPPIPSWGTMIKAHYGYIIMDKAYLAFLPGIAIMLMVLTFTLIGNGLRDALDTKSE